jgi:hypothetical protein
MTGVAMIEMAKPIAERPRPAIGPLQPIIRPNILCKCCIWRLVREAHTGVPTPYRSCMDDELPGLESYTGSSSRRVRGKAGVARTSCTELCIAPEFYSSPYMYALTVSRNFESAMSMSCRYLYRNETDLSPGSLYILFTYTQFMLEGNST